MITAAGTLPLSFALATLPYALGIDPGASSECPNDMRLVTGTHHEYVQHYCIDPRADAKDTHCFAYFEGLSCTEIAARATPAGAARHQLELRRDRCPDR